MNRVVITGMGVVSPLGNDLETFHNNLNSGVNGIDRLTRFDTADYAVKLAAEVKDMDLGLSRRDLLFDSAYINYARAASLKAYRDSGLDGAELDRDAFGVYIATSMGGAEKIGEGFDVLFHKGPSRMSPMILPSILPNTASGKVAIDLRAKGSNMAPAAACSSGAIAIGEAFLKIRHGYEQVMAAGASDASITPFAVSCFSAMKVMYRGENREEASIPFDKRRSGFVIGEGAAVLILEELNHALERNAPIYAELVGYGNSCDAFHIVSPDYRDLSCKKAMQRALRDAQLCESDIAYINAHGTSTSLNDKTEALAINEVFPSRPYLSSTKSMTGHLLGASGSLEAVISIMALRSGSMPPMIHYREADPDCDLNFVLDAAQPNPAMRYVMSNSFGFGGHNACLIFKKWE